MFEDIRRMLDAIAQESRNQAEILPKSFHNLIPDIESALVSALVEAAIDAMNKTPEYSTSEAEPLRKQLIKNLSAYVGNRPVHIRVTEDGKVSIFDEDFAGTAGDFAQAKHPSKNPQQTRYRFWKYGIYARDVEGTYEPSSQKWFNNAVDKLPSYDEIIEERLSVWGEKAPYWYFIEYGTTGGGRGWPSFPGTFFIRSFTQQAKEATRKFHDDAIREYTTAAVESVVKAASQGKTQVKISKDEMLGRIVRKNGNAIWQRREKGRFASGPTFKE